jgi:hypothetical protein
MEVGDKDAVMRISTMSLGDIFQSSPCSLDKPPHPLYPYSHVLGKFQ